ncbi:MAG: M1 family aminopeptidase, partial [Bacteroidia bacterium]|nr:M1 family aminopeptidase [Bacteroidia bacterium]
MFRRIKLTLWLALSLVITNTFTFAQQAAIDVLHYDINLSVLSIASQQISGFTKVQFRVNQPTLQQIQLDLLRLTVDSVKFQNQVVSHSYNDTVLTINLPVSLTFNQTDEVSVYYRGTPPQDPNGFGGFYFSTDTSFAFNLGVSLSLNPHNFGKVWFPCVDNFTDKALYDFRIRTVSNRIAVCGGTLQSETIHPDGTKTWHWKLRDPIPTYLASVAISNYTAVRDTFQGQLGPVPISIYVRPSDTTAARNSFTRLKLVLADFEAKFGPYRWERVGYVAVPFTGGAMEHATNIAYPLVAINGTSAFETLWAHELSHSWFGNLATCESAEEMWLNEGFARYCEVVFQESIYSKTQARNYLRNIHRNVLQFAHLPDADSGYYPVSGVPSNITYGSTVYDKGATVAHSLRSQTTDSLFWAALRQYMNVHAWKNVTSDSLQQIMSIVTGVNFQPLFDGWVYSPGHPHFSIDSVRAVGTNLYSVHVRQKLRQKPNYVTNMRLKLTFWDAQMNRTDRYITINGATANQIYSLPFEPKAVFIDADEEVCDATTDYFQFFKAPTVNFTFQGCQFYANVVTVGSDSVLMRVTHNWVAPDPFKVPIPNVTLANRYWTIEGIWTPNFRCKGNFSYDGGTTGSNRYLDTEWLSLPEDSIVLLYREGTWDDWKILTQANRIIGNATDKRGRFELDSLKAGEYTLGFKTVLVNQETEMIPNKIKVIPNPVSGKITIQFPSLLEKAKL